MVSPLPPPKKKKEGWGRGFTVTAPAVSRAAEGDDIRGSSTSGPPSQCPVTDRTPAPDEAEMPKVKYN